MRMPLTVMSVYVLIEIAACGAADDGCVVMMMRAVMMNGLCHKHAGMC